MTILAYFELSKGVPLGFWLGPVFKGFLEEVSIDLFGPSALA